MEKIVRSKMDSSQIFEHMDPADILRIKVIMALTILKLNRPHELREVYDKEVGICISITNHIFKNG